MAETMRLLLEIGKGPRRVVAAATDWPGLDRWGKTEDAAIERLLTYVPRYAAVADRAGLAPAFARQSDVEVVERTPGSSSTDFWGIAHVPSELEREVLDSDALERRLTLLQACWATFDDIIAGAPAALQPSGRSGGWTREEIVRHVNVNEPGQFSRKVEVRTPREEVLTPDGLARHRAAYLDAIRAYNAEARTARTWPIQFLIRRTAHHVMDHAWEVEDRS